MSGCDSCISSWGCCPPASIEGYGAFMQGHGRRVVLQKDAWLHALQALAADESAAAHAPQPQASGKSHTHAGDALPAAALQQVSMAIARPTTSYLAQSVDASVMAYCALHFRQRTSGIFARLAPGVQSSLTMVLQLHSGSLGVLCHCCPRSSSTRSRAGI